MIITTDDGGRTWCRNRKPEKSFRCNIDNKKKKEGQYEQKVMKVCMEEFDLNQEEVFTSLKKAVDDRMLKIARTTKTLIA